MTALSLPACGAGSLIENPDRPTSQSTATTVPQGNSPLYAKLTDKRPEKRVIAVTSVSANSDNLTGSIIQETTGHRVIGELNMESGAISFPYTPQSQSVFMDPDGYDKALWLWDGSLDGMSLKGLSDNAAFDYVDGLWGYFGLWSSEHRIRHVKLFGFATLPKDMPTKSNAQYKGIANGDLLYQGKERLLKNGVALVNVDFKNHTVTARFDKFRDTDIRVTLKDMKIDQSAFSGGTHDITLDGQTITLGDKMSAKSMGQFYGYDAEKGIPDELGGGLITTGTEGTLAILYLAD